MPPFTFRKAGRRWIEFQALPGPEARALGAKSMRHDSLSSPGGLLNAECRLRNGKKEAKNSEFHIPNSELGNTRWARPILRRSGEISEWISFPADAFCAQRPCSRATSLLSQRKKNRKSEGGVKGFLSLDRLPHLFVYSIHPRPIHEVV